VNNRSDITGESVDVRDDTIRHQTTIALPVVTIFHTAVRVVSQTAVYEQYSEVDRIEVRQNVIETCQHTAHVTSELIRYDIW